MKKILLFIMVVLTITVSCSKDDSINLTDEESSTENDSITYFTLKVGKNYVGEVFNSGYIIINDNEGNILEHAPIENEKEYVFKAKKGEEKESFTVSRLTNRDRTNFKTNILVSYFNVKKGAVWNFKGFATSGGTTTTDETTPESPSFSLKIQNIDGFSNVAISSVNGGVGYSFSGTDNSIDYDPISFDANQNKFMLTIHFKTEKSKYIFIDNIQDGQEIIVDGSELKEFDSYVPITLPNDGNIYRKELMASLNPEERFEISPFYNRIENVEASNFGILKDFYNFRASVSTSNPEKNYSYRYDVESAELEAISIPQYGTDFKLINNSINAFQFTVNYLHDTKSSKWSYDIDDFENRIFRYDSWVFHSNGLPYQTIPKLPQEFLNKYPNFKIENLQYEDTIFSNGFDYETFFSGASNSENNQRIWEYLTFRNPDYDKSFKKNEAFEKMIEEFESYNR